MRAFTKGALGCEDQALLVPLCVLFPSLTGSVFGGPGRRGSAQRTLMNPRLNGMML